MDDFNGRFNEDLIFSLLPRGARATIMKESNLSGSGRPDRGKNKKGGKPGMDTKRIALVPAYEPSEQLLMLLPQLTGAGLSVVVVDDGSGPDFAPLFQKAAEYGTVLTHPVNRGKGAALKTGYRWLSEHVAGPFTVVAVDADGQHRLPDVLRLCEEAERTPEVLVLGGRAFQGKVPLRSRVGNAITRFVFTLSTGLRVHDTQTGLRACGRELLPFLLSVEGERYEYEMNVLLDCSRQKVPLREVPIETVYIDDNASSHFDALRDSVRIYKEILKFSLSSLTAFAVDYLLFALLSPFAGEWLANILARVVSAAVNFTINRRMVFCSDKPLLRSALQYALLAAVILAGNTLLLTLLVEKAGMPGLLAKLLVELVFFLLSWTVQRCLIFRRRAKTAES